MVYSEEAEQFVPRAWSAYEVVEETLEQALEKEDYDNLSDLASPWDPRHTFLRPEPTVDPSSDPALVEEPAVEPGVE